MSEDSTCKGRTWRSEHPDIIVDESLIPEHFKDDSWVNDSCNSFYSERYCMKLWIDHEDEEQREVAGFRYSLVYDDPEGWIASAVCFAESEDMADIKRALQTIDFDAYIRQLKWISRPEDVVTMMDSIAHRISDIEYLKRSYDEVELDLIKLAELYKLAGEHWTNLMEKQV